ncbi:MAG: CotH kinase family protein [Candidatus Limiplasma sp.]|nr:CotH kinase family protein [Candidatus Limiplasma sp.]
MGWSYRSLRGFLLGCLLALVLPALAQGESALGLSYVANPSARSSTAILPQQVQDKTYLFLPSSADLTALRLEMDQPMLLRPQGGAPGEAVLIQSGQPFDLLALFPQGPLQDGYPISLAPSGGDDPNASLDLILMVSGHLGSLYITSDDPVNQGRAWIDGQDRAHVQAATGSMALLREDGSALYDDALTQLRPRGNTTWFWGQKKPYQLKLAYKSNLLDTGDSRDSNKTWLLLAEAFDATLLHNSVTLDLGQEVGLFGTPQYRPVDLYYDGEYRGTYLLCEKVEVKPGRLDILDYGKYIEKLYEKLTDIDALPTAQGRDAHGNLYQYVQGIEVQMGQAGSYLLELDLYGYEVEKSWVSSSDGLHYVLRSPAYLSQGDAEYVSGFLQEMLDTIANHGVHPATGKTIDQYLDLPSFVRYFLVHEFAKTCDFWYTSTYFYLPQGSHKLYAGPLWDFDVAYAMRDTRPHEGGIDGYVPQDGWFRQLMTLPVFQEAVQRYFQEEFLPLLQNVLLGPEEARGETLLSLQGYLRRIDPSRRMNYILWELGGHYNNINKETLYPTFEENIAYFQNYLEGRTQWMAADIAQWSGREIKEVNLTLTYANANIPGYAQVQVDVPYSNTTLTDVSWAWEKNAQSPDQTFYTASISLKANVGSSFTETPVVRVNGFPAKLLSRDAEHVTLSYRFLGPTFEPAVYEGVDYALVYQYDAFLKENPQVVEECGTDDPEALLDYYVYYGMRDGLRAISTFDPETFLTNYEKLLDSYYMLDMESSILHYLENCYQENLLGIPEPVKPEPAV